MEIGENGHHGHHVHVPVVVLCKNRNDLVIIQGKLTMSKLSYFVRFISFCRPENGGQYCSGQSTRIRSCENNPVTKLLDLDS